MWRKTLTLASVLCVGLTATLLTAQEPDDIDTLRQKAIKTAMNKVALFLIQYATMRAIGVRRARAALSAT